MCVFVGSPFTFIQTGVPAITSVSARFSEPVILDSLTVADNVVLAQKKIAHVGECRQDEQIMIDLLVRMGLPAGRESLREVIDSQLGAEETARDTAQDGAGDTAGDPAEDRVDSP